MDFYFDENFSHYVASALNELEKAEGEHRVFSTKIEFGEGIKDEELIPMIGKQAVYCSRKTKGLPV